MFNKKLLINEIFLSIQGESINTVVNNNLPIEHLGVGTPTIFIRTQKCICNCRYCDTKYARNGSEAGIDMTIKQILDECNKLSQGVYKNICITGGEPGIQENIIYLIEALKGKGYVIGVETSGAVDIRKFCGLTVFSDSELVYGSGVITPHSADCIVMDWKGPSAGVKTMQKMVESNWEYLRQCDQVKFLIKEKLDWDFMIKTLKRTKILDRKDRPVILVSPVFDNKGNHNAQRVVKWLLESKLPLVLNLQIHKLIWDVNKRGV